MKALLRTTGSLAAVVLLLMSVAAVASAQEASDITLDSPFRSFELGVSEVRVDLDVKLRNSAEDRRLVKLTIEALPGEEMPEGWAIAVWNRFFDYKIGELLVEPTTEDTPPQNLRLRIALPATDDEDYERPPAGDYPFVLNVTSPDGSVLYERAVFTVTLPEAPPEEDEEAGSLILRSSFPVLSGPATSRYEFEVVIRNETGEERSFDLKADVLNESLEPVQNWQIAFLPRFGDEKIISTISVPNNLTENVKVRVTPPRNTPPGDYLIPVTVSSEGQVYEEISALTLNIRGQGSLSATTDTGLLNVDATAGSAASIVLRLWNLGTAPLTDINLSADRPPDWKVTYSRDAVDELSDLSGENWADIALTIEPPGDAVPGDYLVTLRASNAESTDTVEMRVTVTQSTIWGWLGIVLVLSVLGGLLGLFVRLGRR